jgi:CubicO group peptidase (beta-lactamase class C family)
MTVADLAFGTLTDGRALTVTEPMRLYSGSKPYVAAALGLLWSNGKLDPTDPVADYFPDYAARGKEDVRIAHLLTHTACLLGEDEWVASGPATDDATCTAAACSAQLDPAHPPGSAWRYSFYWSWAVLGTIVEIASGVTCSEFVTNRILEPLEMMSTAYIAEETNHTAIEPNVVGARVGVDLVGPCREVGRFYEMIAADGTWKKTRLMSPSTARALRSARSEVPRLGGSDVARRVRTAYGMLLEPPAGHRSHPTFGRHCSQLAFGHDGGNNAIAYADPAYDVVVVVNGTGQPSFARRQVAWMALNAHIYKDLGFASLQGSPSSLGG